MLLNLRVVEIYSGFYSYLPIGGLIGLLFLFELIYLIFFDFEKNSLFIDQNKNILVVDQWIEIYNYKSNLSLLGELLFNFYIHFFLIAAFILLVAMIGSIVLTLDHVSNFQEENFEKIKYILEKKKIAYLKPYEKRRYKN